MRLVFSALLAGASLLFCRAGSAAATERVCQPPAVDLLTLAGHTPRQVAELLRPLLGPPLAETNSLPDGGTFTRLADADQMDGVSQRFAWGGQQGSLEVIYQRGLAELASARLEEFEVLDKDRVLPVCRPWSRTTLASSTGIDPLPARPASLSHSGHFDLLRYVLLSPVGASARLRCRSANSNECVEATVYYPHERSQAAAAKTKVATDAPAPIASPAETVAATPPRRPLRSN